MYKTDLLDLRNMDCMELMAQYPDKHFELAIVDPPYGLKKSSSEGSGKLKDRALNKGLIKSWDNAPGEEYFKELFRVSVNQIIWGGELFQLAAMPLLYCLGQSSTLAKLFSM